VSGPARPGALGWALGATIVVWIAVVVISVFSPDLVSGSEQQHLPVAAFGTWLWGTVATVGVLVGGGLVRRAGEALWWVAPAAATMAIWVVASLVSVFAPTMETGTDPTTIPLAALIAPVVAALLTCVAYAAAAVGGRWASGS
jgi:hypothetical protein